MNISIILAHPKKDSFNHAIAHTAARAAGLCGHKVVLHDLYREKFDPLLPRCEIPSGIHLHGSIKKYCDELQSADGIIIVHPNWWGQPPAILKGWVDRIVRPGVAYRFEEGDKGEGVPVGLLRAKTALVFNTSNTYTIREKNVFGDPLEMIWKNCIFGLCGVKCVRKTYGVVVTSTKSQRKGWLKDVEKIVLKRFPSEKR